MQSQLQLKRYIQGVFPRPHPYCSSLSPPEFSPSLSSFNFLPLPAKDPPNPWDTSAPAATRPSFPLEEFPPSSCERPSSQAEKGGQSFSGEELKERGAVLCQNTAQSASK